MILKDNKINKEPINRVIIKLYNTIKKEVLKQINTQIKIIKINNNCQLNSNRELNKIKLNKIWIIINNKVKINYNNSIINNRINNKTNKIKCNNFTINNKTKIINSHNGITKILTKIHNHKIIINNNKTITKIQINSNRIDSNIIMYNNQIITINKCQHNRAIIINNRIIKGQIGKVVWTNKVMKFIKLLNIMDNYIIRFQMHMNL